MKLYHKGILVLFYLTILFTLLYSYVLIDPNITLFNNSLWSFAREIFIRLGYFQRTLSTFLYIALVTILFLLHYLLVKNYKSYKIRYIVPALILLGIFSYPLLSHDFFNYLFDAKIVTYYHANPYIHKALDFPQDPWIRFMHWTHRTYPYGPLFLVMSLIPSFLSFGKLILAIIFFKTFFLGFYLGALFYLYKINKRLALIWATHPLIVIEGLVVSHNDIVGISLAVIGIYFLLKNKKIASRVLLLASALIKYITFPTLFLSKKNMRSNFFIFLATLGIIVYISLTGVIQPWYFLNIFLFLPFFEDAIAKFNIFFAGLLLSYYPFLLYGDWDKIHIKNTLILGALTLNLLYITIRWFMKKRKSSFS